MRRREFIALLGGASASAWPLKAHAQAGPVKRIGVLLSWSERDVEGPPRVAMLKKGLEELGWMDGVNLQATYRFGAGDQDRIRAYAAELVSLKPDAIVATSGTVLRILKDATSEIPIIAQGVSDPVGSGFVQSLSRPGGNITGLTLFEYQMVGKWLGTLKELAPHLTRVALFQNAKNPNWPSWTRAAEPVAGALRLEIIAPRLSVPSDIADAVRNLSTQPNSGLVVLPDPFLSTYRDRVLSIVNEHRLPAIYSNRYWPENGGLLSYGVDLPTLDRRAAAFVDRVLRGEKPSEIPIEQPTKFQLVLNLRTASALGLTIPPMLLARADEVIE